MFVNRSNEYEKEQNITNGMFNCRFRASGKDCRLRNFVLTENIKLRSRQQIHTAQRYS